MNLTLPNGDKVFLNNEIDMEEKMKLVEKILVDIDAYILSTWLQEDGCKYILDVLASYLVWHKEDEDLPDNYEDKEVMSRNKMNRIKNGSKDIPFSNLSVVERINIDGGEIDEQNTF